MAIYAKINKANELIQTVTIEDSQEVRLTEHLAELGLEGNFVKVEGDWGIGWVYEDGHFVNPEPASESPEIAPRPDSQRFYDYDPEKNEWFLNEPEGFTWDEENQKYIPPIAYPDDGLFYIWDFEAGNWVEVLEPEVNDNLE